MNYPSIWYRTFIFSFLLFNSISAQYIEITKPEENQKFPDISNPIEIAWKTSIKTGNVRIEYSIDGKTYNELSSTGINEGSYIWYLSSNIGKNKRGDLYIRVIVSEKEIINDDVKVLVPELATTGSIVFESPLDNVEIEYVIRDTFNIYNKVSSTFKVGEIIRSLEPGEYHYLAEKKNYGQKKGKVVIKAGKREKIKLNITKTWGSVTFTSNTENFNVLIKKQKPSKSDKDIVKRVNDLVHLPSGRYSYQIEEKGFKAIFF
mgnify:CR=1 FL=1